MSEITFNPVDHPHRRYNPLTGQWILVSPHRAKRPWSGQDEKPAIKVLPKYDEHCFYVQPISVCRVMLTQIIKAPTCLVTILLR